MAQAPAHTPLLFIGAGPTTIGACYRLRDKGIKDYFVIEAQDQFGGLSSSFKDPQGFTWDLGGHVQFSHYKEFDQAMDEACQNEGWLTHQRESWVWIKNKFVPYPFQYNFQLLGNALIQKCLQGLNEKQYKESTPKNFEEWLKKEFGQGLCDLFMLPYNEKVWAYPPKMMNHEWISERVATIDMKRINKNIESKALDVSWGPNATFRFPGEGGTGRIWNNLGKNTIGDRILFKTKVTSIDPIKKVATLNNNQTIGYDKLLSTMPLDCLLNMTHTSSLDSIRKLTNQLLHSSSHIIGFGIKGRPPKDLVGKCWMYFPENNSPYYRVTLFSHYSPKNVPDINKHYSLMVEVSESQYKNVSDNIIEESLSALIQDGLILDKENVISKWYKRLEYGYPTPSLQRNQIVPPTHKALEQFDIYSRGRFGHWHYEVSNQDHSFMQGYEWVDWLYDGKEESTLWRK